MTVPKLNKYAVDFTPRHKVRYRVGSDIVTSVYRPVNATAETALVLFWELLLVVKGALEPTGTVAPLSFLSADYALADSRVFLPLNVTTSLTGMNATGTMTSLNRASLLSFVGRGNDGTKSIIYLPGMAIEPGNTVGQNNWRYEASEIGSWGDIEDALSAFSAVVTTRSGATPKYSPYINVSVWRSKITTYRR